MMTPPDSIKMAVKDSIAQADSLAQKAENWDFSDYLTKISSITTNAYFSLLCSFIIVFVVFILVCLFRSLLNKPSKWWASLPTQDWRVFFLLDNCRNKYRKRQEIIMNTRAEEKMFDYILENRWSPKRDRNKARELLSKRARAYKFFNGDHFNAEDYRQWVLEYETEGVDIEGLISKLPAPLKVFERAKQFAILIKDKVLDENCLPPEKNPREKGFYYTLAEVIWEKGNGGNREMAFAELWAGKGLWEGRTQKEVANALKQGVAYSKNESIKREQYINEINQILKE